MASFQQDIDDLKRKAGSLPMSSCVVPKASIMELNSSRWWIIASYFWSPGGGLFWIYQVGWFLMIEHVAFGASPYQWTAWFDAMFWYFLAWPAICWVIPQSRSTNGFEELFAALWLSWCSRESLHQPCSPGEVAECRCFVFVMQGWLKCQGIGVRNVSICHQFGNLFVAPLLSSLTTSIHHESDQWSTINSASWWTAFSIPHHTDYHHS